MASFGLDAYGQPDDRVRLVLDGAEVLVAESYEVHAGILTQPAAWSVRLGYGDVIRKLLPLARPGARCKVYVGPVLQFVGQVDGFTASGEVGATELTIEGRDALAPLHDAYVTGEISIRDASFRDLVEGALARTVGDYTLSYSNDANRRVRTGVGIAPPAPPTSAAEVQVDTSPKAIRVAVQAKLGEREYEFVKRQLDRAGLFLWAGASGGDVPEFVLSAPTAAQPPCYRIARRRGARRNEVTAISARWQNRTQHRFTEAVVYARGGGRKFARSKIKGHFVDPEMTEWLAPVARPLVVRDANVATAAQAEFYARRKIAESIRAGWTLTYTVKGHATPSLVGGGLAVWTPDTVVQVADDEFGLSGPYYLESCIYRGGPSGRTTELTLLRPDALVFASGED